MGNNGIEVVFRRSVASGGLEVIPKDPLMIVAVVSGLKSEERLQR